MDGATGNSDNSKRDRALCYHWKANDSDWVKSLNLPAPRNRKHDQARASVLLEALIADRVAPEQFVSYSRRKEWWGTGTRYRDTAYTYATVIPAIDDLTRWGLLEHDRKPPRNLGWQSRFRATPILLRSLAIPPVIYDPVELVRLKDHDGKLTDYRETNNTISMRRRLEEVNEALSAAELQLNHPTVCGSAATRHHIIAAPREGAAIEYPVKGSHCRVQQMFTHPKQQAVKLYLHDEIAARGLRQSDLARRLGISRPQLVNILRGRFGASPRITLGLKAFADCPDFEFDNPLPAPVPRTQ